MSPPQRGPWHLVVLAAVAVAIVVAAVLELGPPSSSARTSRELITAEKGVVQSTVTGSGNVEPGTEVFANFKTSGTLADVFVSVGQHVHQGQLLATLDPTSAQLAVNQAQLSLDAAQDELTAAEDGSSSGSSDASGSSSGLGSGSGSGGEARTSVEAPGTEFVSEQTETDTGTETATTTTSTPPATTTPSTGSKTRTAPSAQTQPGHGSTSGDASHGSAGSSRASRESTSTTQDSTTPSPAAIASAQAAVDSAELNLRSAQNALAETKLYAPAGGTVVSLASTSPGDEVSAAGSSTSTATGSGASGSGAAASGTGGSGASSSAAGSLSSSGTASSSSSSSSGFAEIVDTHQLTMTVAFSESDITKVKVGQPATVTLDALTGVELAAHVSSISTLGTDDDGVVSYDATLTLDQHNASVRPGMSASAAVITSQAQGVTLPSSAVTGDGSLATVDLLRAGRAVSTQVVVGIKGDSRTQIVSGLHAGQQVVVTTVLPSLTAPAASSSSVGGFAGLRARFGGGGFGGGGASGGGFAGGGFGGGGG
ncbi:MAG TPA: HlyD family efflux transporter periplasmic adaptor subunit [Solirubrobacteraceae bacterium]|nr:HlyD family efflux transporter periplasmic adaptor subunit [Solirubrobacteraceae bacterium]